MGVPMIPALAFAFLAGVIASATADVLGRIHYRWRVRKALQARWRFDPESYP